MKKFAFILTLLLTLCLFAGPVIAADYWAEVYKQDNTTVGEMELEPVTSGITFKVLTINTDTAATCTVFGSGTSLTNPVTTTNFAAAAYCDGKVKFRTSATTVDLIVVDTAGGYTAFVEDFSPNDHKIIIDERANVMHHGMIWFGASDNSSVDTGIDFLKDTMITDVVVEIVTVDNTETLNVGTADTAAGFINTLSLATSSEGYKTDTGFITGGSTIDYVPATQYGTLLTTAITGSDVVATVGGNTRKAHFVVTTGTDDDLTYIGSAGSDTAAGYIHYFFMRLR